MAGLYIHIPFCKQFCNYCDFHSSSSLALKPLMLSRMSDEMEQRRSFVTDQNLDTIYIGGGTPSICSPQELGSFVKQAARLWDTRALSEVTVETNPDDINPIYLDELLIEGFNRISIGIQSFNDQHLKWFNRRHSSAAAIKAVEEAKRAGFKDISIDLIYGFHSLSTSQWRQNLEQAIDLRPQHISAYDLIVEPNTTFGRAAAKGEKIETDQESSIAQYQMMRTMLKEAGYEHYEVSNFAQPSHRAQHNSSYWRGDQYLGLGPAAHSYNGTERTWNISNNKSYIEKQPTRVHFQSEILTPRDLYNEYIMTSLRWDLGVDVNTLKSRFGAEKAEYFARSATKFIDSGSIIKQSSIYKIPTEHYFISDGIIAELFLN